MEVLRGNPALFMRRDEVEAAWHFIDARYCRLGVKTKSRKLCCRILGAISVIATARSRRSPVVSGRVGNRSNGTLFRVARGRGFVALRQSVLPLRLNAAWMAMAGVAGRERRYDARENVCRARETRLWNGRGSTWCSATSAGYRRTVTTATRSSYAIRCCKTTPRMPSCCRYLPGRTDVEERCEQLGDDAEAPAVSVCLLVARHGRRRSFCVAVSRRRTTWTRDSSPTGSNSGCRSARPRASMRV